MSVALASYTGNLTRQVVPLGGSLPSGVSSTTLTRYLVDAFWQARLDGLLEGYTVDPNGVITPLDDGPDLDQKWVALIVLYAAITILANQILNTRTQFRAKAGNVEFEQSTSATMLAEMLKQLRSTKNQILAEFGELAAMTPTFYLDAYSTRLFTPFPNASYYGAPELT